MRRAPLWPCVEAQIHRAGVHGITAASIASRINREGGRPLQIVTARQVAACCTFYLMGTGRIDCYRLRGGVSIYFPRASA